MRDDTPKLDPWHCILNQGTMKVVEHLGRLTGYSTWIGCGCHAVAERNDDLKALIGAAPDFSDAGFLVPSRNADLSRWCLSQGLRVVSQAILLTFGLYNDPLGAYLPYITH